jgi:lipopolysaccharide/colanic/teichoic acid biosynthesis glycosyltransferase
MVPFIESSFIKEKPQMLAQHLSPASHPPADHGRPQRMRLISHPDRFKRVFDLVVAVTMSIVALPIIGVAYILIRATTAGPGFYSQVRVGRNGRHYRIYKLRTMYHNCEAISGAAWSTKQDNRITRVGRVLRKLHIDELPQLLNVLRGEMSIVGPRPERPEFVGLLAREIPGYQDRLLVRPGVTGLAQIQLPADEDLEDVRKKVVLDRCYAEKRDLWLDFRIVLGTAVYLLGFSYGTVRKVLILPNPLADHSQGKHPPSGIAVGPFVLSRGVPEAESSLAPGVKPIPCGETQ